MKKCEVIPRFLTWGNQVDNVAKQQERMQEEEQICVGCKDMFIWIKMKISCCGYIEWSCFL